MKYIDVDWHVPYDNFALEEYLLEHAPEDDYLFFYINDPSIIIGSHQNTAEEINEAFVKEHHIMVARRMSGGGAVYHDAGNLSFSFVKPGDRSDVNNFEAFTRPIVEVLRNLGTDAKLSGRNDLHIGDKKISGNASCFRNGRILSHGTLLFDTDMSKLGDALRVKEIKLKSKGVQSVRSRVGNIKDFLTEDMSVYDLRKAILEYFRENEGVEPYVLSDEALAHIQARSRDHFSTWAWNWGESPSYDLQRMAKFTSGLIDVRLNVERGIIKGMTIFGDFFTWKDPADLSARLINVAFTQEALTKALQEEDIDAYFKGLDVDTFVDFLLHE